MSSAMPPATPPMARPPARPWSAKDARAHAKAHAARIKALRPWYQKKRYLLAIAIIAVIGFAFANSTDSQSDNLGPPQTAYRFSRPITNDIPANAIVTIEAASRPAT